MIREAIWPTKIGWLGSLHKDVDLAVLGDLQ